MFLKCVLSLLLPIICEANIKLNITAASYKRGIIAKFTGADNKLITDHEVDLFNVSIPNLNYGVKIELGRVPNGIFLKDPTPYGNLFHKYKWPETKRHLKVEKIEVVEVIAKEVVLKVEEYVNNSTDDIVVKKMSLYTDVENNAYSNWSKNGLPEDEAFYEVAIKFENSTFVYKNKWRNANVKTYFTKFGKTIKTHFTLKSGHAVDKKLSAKKTIFVLRVHYKAQLIGNLITDYENLYGKYHFYAPTVDNIMRAGNIVNEIKTNETIEIRCFTDPKLEIFDKESGAPIKLHRKIKLFWKTDLDKFW